MGTAYAYVLYYGIAGNAAEKGFTVEWSNLIVSVVDVPYTPYKETHYPIPEAIQALPQFGVGLAYKPYSEVLYMPNYIEVLSNGKIKYHLQSYRYTVNGTEPWKMATDGGFALSRSAFNNVTNSLTVWAEAADRYKALSYQEYLDKKDGIYGAQSASLRIFDSRFTTVEDFKNHLKANPLDIIYAINTVVETELAAEMRKIIEVEGGGYLEFKNDKGNAVPSDVAFITSK